MGQAAKPPGVEDDAPEAGELTGEPLYSPTEVSSTRMREQGLGMGADELRLQRDPTGAATSAEEREASGTTAWDESDAEEAEGSTGAEGGQGGVRSDPRH